MNDIEKGDSGRVNSTAISTSSSDDSITFVSPPLTREISYRDVLKEVESHKGYRDDGEQIIVTFHPTDPDNPNNWHWKKKWIIVWAGIITVMNSTLGSSLPSNAIDAISKDFHLTSDIQQALPVSMYLIGYVLGPLLWGPLSEQYGRKPTMLISFLLYTIFTLACALAPDFSSFLVFRLLTGSNASSPIAIVGGLYADVYHCPRKRGYAMAYFMAATTFGPCLGPIVSGGISMVTTWRWVFYFSLIFSGVSIPFVVIMPESYAPILLRRKAKQLRSQTGNPNIVARFELEPQTWRYLATTVLSRPFHMLIHESIVLFTCIYISLAYGILYLFFQAYPIIFQGTNSVYHFTPLQSGLAFIPIGIGACLCAFIFFAWDHYLYKHIALRSPWTSIEEYRRLPLACLGGPFLVLSLFWLGFTSSTTPALNPFIPILSGTTFGLGFLLIMMAMLNYLTDAYETYAASAQAVASCCRSVFGALLPLAAAKMFSTLGIRWACATLGFIALVVTCIPFGFVRWGERIRGGSKFCRELKKIKEREEREEESRRQREMEMEMDKQRKRDGQVVGGGDYDNNDDYDGDE